MLQDLDSIRAEQLLSQAESSREAFLDALSDEVAVLDSAGRIVAVNEAWKRFARDNGDESLQSTGVGQNYLDVCLNAAAAGHEDAEKAIEGLRGVLKKAAEQFVMEYECSSPGERRWFLFTATSLAHMAGALISHRNITERRKLEEVLRLSGEVDTVSPLFESFLPALVRNLALALNARHAFLSELLDQATGRVRLLTHWTGDGYGPLREYNLKGIPAEQVLSGRTCIFPSGVQKLFPDDPRLKDIDAESYIAVPLLDAGGRPLGHIGVIDTKPLADVSFAETTLRVFAARITPELERRNAERRLAEQSRLIHNAPDAVIATDENLVITYWNKAAEKTYGWRAHEALGRTVIDVLKPEFSEAERADLQRLLLERGEAALEVVHHRKDGSPIEIGVTIMALRNHDQHVSGVVSVNRDITAHKVAERALRQAEQKNAAILEAIPDLMFTLDGRGRFLSFTPAQGFQPFVQPSAFLGKHVGEVMPPDIAASAMKAIDACLRSGQTQTCEYQLVDDGLTMDFECRIVRIGPDEVLAVIRDYTAQKQQEREALERRTAMLSAQGRVTRAGDKPRLLIVDEDVKTLRFLRRALEQSGNRATVTSDPAEALSLVELQDPDLILLDIALANGNGFELFREVRRFSGVPIIAVADADHVDDAVRALRAGADDYITKPFSPAELIARVEAALHRRQAPERAPSEPREFGELVVDPVARLVTVGGNPISLTATEYRLLLELADSTGRVLTHNEILDRVWGPGYAGQYDLLRSFVRTLRRKLGDDARHPRFVLSERGVGYRLVKPAA
jgi:two-component system KDP operon response regulator KdpE